MTATTSTTSTPARPGTAPVVLSKSAESALPSVAAVPSRIGGERPTTGVPFTRLIHVELRKMLDTRAGRWLLIGIGAVIAIALTIMFFNNGGQHSFGMYLQATTKPIIAASPAKRTSDCVLDWSMAALTTGGPPN